MKKLILLLLLIVGCAKQESKTIQGSETFSVISRKYPNSGKIQSINTYEVINQTDVIDSLIIDYDYQANKFYNEIGPVEWLNALKPLGTDANKKFLEEATQNGYRYITDQDARPNGGAHPYAHLWDNGADATEELEQMLKVREVAIKQFSVDNIKSDEPYTVLEDVFVPIYLFHRYQTEAAVKQIGGLNYSYAVKGSNQEVVSLVSKNKQEAALNAVLKTVDATVIAVPQEKLNLFPPRAFGYSASRESLKGKFNIGFDALSAAETAAEMTLNLLLNDEKASRLIQQKALDKNQLSLQDVLDELLKETVYKTEKDSYLNEVQNTVNYRVVWHIMKLAKSEDVLPQVNAIANHTLKTIKEKYTNNNDANKAEIAYRITQFYKDPEKFSIPKSPKIPDGSPIGMSCFGKL